MSMFPNWPGLAVNDGLVAVNAFYLKLSNFLDYWDLCLYWGLRCSSCAYVFDWLSSLGKLRRDVGLSFLEVYSVVAIIFLNGFLFSFSLLFLLVDLCFSSSSPVCLSEMMGAVLCGLNRVVLGP